MLRCCCGLCSASRAILAATCWLDASLLRLSPRWSACALSIGCELLGDIDNAVAWATKALAAVRAVDRLRFAEGIDDAEVQLRREAVFDHIAACEVVSLDSAVLTRASMPLPTALGTLDAMHLATASLWREMEGADLVFATHDRQLGRAAAAMGFTVVGLS